VSPCALCWNNASPLKELPALPESFGELQYQRPSGMWGRLEGFTAEQMRAYGKACAAAGVLAERERCAKTAESWTSTSPTTCANIADARKEPPWVDLDSGEQRVTPRPPPHKRPPPFAKGHT